MLTVCKISDCRVVLRRGMGEDRGEEKERKGKWRLPRGKVKQKKETGVYICRCYFMLCVFSR